MQIAFVDWDALAAENALGNVGGDAKRNALPLLVRVARARRRAYWQIPKRRNPVGRAYRWSDQKT